MKNNFLKLRVMNSPLSLLPGACKTLLKKVFIWHLFKSFKIWWLRSKRETLGHNCVCREFLQQSSRAFNHNSHVPAPKCQVSFSASEIFTRWKIKKRKKTLCAWICTSNFFHKASVWSTLKLSGIKTVCPHFNGTVLLENLLCWTLLRARSHWVRIGRF